MKTLIFGGKGYIGTAYFNSGVFSPVFLSGADITKIGEVESDIVKYEPDVVINCAGKTNLEWCRDNRSEAILINVAGPINVLNICKKKDIYFVHIGSGCIFEGNGKDSRGFTENDEPQPQCFYAYTKAIADDLLMRMDYNKSLVLRIRQPFSEIPGPRNLITKLLTYDKLINSQNSATYIPDLIAVTEFLISKTASGIFNTCNSGTISPYEIVMLAKSILGLEKEFTPISKAELDEMDKGGGREKRVDTIINIDKLTAAGFKMPDVKERVISVLKSYRLNKL